MSGSRAVVGGTAGGGVNRGREEEWRGESSALAGDVNSDGVRSLGEPEAGGKERERERE